MSSPEGIENPLPMACRPKIVEKGFPSIKYTEPLAWTRTQPLCFRTSTSGLMEPLPAELKQNILMNLDLATLKSLRLINYEFLSLVDSTPAYRRLQEHAPTILRAFQDTETITFYPLWKIYEALTSNQCTKCHDFGPFLFLLTCERKCFSCLYRDPDLRVMRACDVDTYFAIRPSTVRKLPSMRSLPTKCYKPWFQHYQKRWKMILLDQAQEVAINFHGGAEKMEERTTADYEQKIERYHAIMQAREIRNSGENRSYHQRPPKVPQSARFLFKHQWNEENEWRWHQNPLDHYCGFAAIEMDWLNPETQVAEKGAWCEGCRRIFHWAMGPANTSPNFDNLKMLERNHFKAWSMKGLSEHFEVCKEQIQMWRDNTASFMTTHNLPNPANPPPGLPQGANHFLSRIPYSYPPPPYPAPHQGFPPPRRRPGYPPPPPPPPPPYNGPPAPPASWPPFPGPRFHIALDARDCLRI